MSTFDTARLSRRTMATITGAAHTMCPYSSASDDLLTRAGGGRTVKVHVRERRPGLR